MKTQLITINTGKLFFIWELLHDNNGTIKDFIIWEDKNDQSLVKIKLILDYSKRKYFSLVYSDQNDSQTIFKISRIRFKTFDDFLKRIGKVLTLPGTIQKIEEANLKWFNDPKFIYVLTDINDFKNGKIVEKITKTTIVITEEQLRFAHKAMLIKPWFEGTLGIDFLNDYVNSSRYMTNVELVFDLWENLSLRYYASDEKFEVICYFPYIADYETFAFTVTAILKQPEVQKRLKEVNEGWFNYKQEVEIKTYQSI